MPAEIEIRGTADFRRMAARLKAAGDGRLTREMVKRMRTAAQPAIRAAQGSVESLRTRSRRGGGGGQQRRAHAATLVRRQTDETRQRAYSGRGLRATIGRALTTRIKSGGSASVKIAVARRMLPPDQRNLPTLMNVGRWKHPVFGNRTRWVAQQARPPGWFDRPMERHAPRIRDQALTAVDEINRQITR